MKKLLVLAAVAVFSTAAFAQDTKTAAAAPTAKPATQETAKPKSSSTHECYMMKDNKLMHCKGDKMTHVKADVKLHNGAMISPKGEITAKDGSKSMLAEGQCCDMGGHMGDCDKMKASMNKAETKPAAK